MHDGDCNEQIMCASCVLMLHATKRATSDEPMYLSLYKAKKHHLVTKVQAHTNISDLSHVRLISTKYLVIVL